MPDHRGWEPSGSVMDSRLCVNDENLDALCQSSFPRRRESMVTPFYRHPVRLLPVEAPSNPGREHLLTERSQSHLPGWMRKEKTPRHRFPGLDHTNVHTTRTDPSPGHLERGRRDTRKDGRQGPGMCHPNVGAPVPGRNSPPIPSSHHGVSPLSAV